MENRIVLFWIVEKEMINELIFVLGVIWDVVVVRDTK
jgi:Na+-transporting NADH:ubiquinone oxidoreductase subunit NqrB